jgi:hypothetical protein
MTIPGFTAGVSDTWAPNQYLPGYGIQRSQPTTDAVVLSTNWGSIADNGCQKGGQWDGTHKYSAILWNIPWGHSWEAACHSTPGPAGSHVAGRLPNNCVTSLNEWGEWYLADNHCPRACPPGCYAANVACTLGLLWNTCWCNDCPQGGWWVGGVCVGGWELNCGQVGMGASRAVMPSSARSSTTA